MKSSHAYPLRIAIGVDSMMSASSDDQLTEEGVLELRPTVLVGGILGTKCFMKYLSA